MKESNGMGNANQNLDKLEGLQQEADRIRKESDAVRTSIRSGLENKAIVFIDMVGSTDFKIEHRDEPEVWILRMKQFSEILSSFAAKTNGRVIKYIGDEVMVTYDNCNDAQNLVARVSEIEQILSSATKYETRVKVAVDYGEVYMLRYTGHDEPDPQGSVVDRCARIARYGKPGEVLAGSAFTDMTKNLNWVPLGSAHLKGIGNEEIFQLHRSSVDLDPMVQARQSEHGLIFIEMEDKIRQLAHEVGELATKNRSLSEEIKRLGELPPEHAVVFGLDNEQGELREAIDEKIREIRELIAKAEVGTTDYARFLFLHRQSAGQSYNKYEGRTFDSLIEHNLVEKRSDNDKYYYLNPGHRRNSKAIVIMDELERRLEAYLEKYSIDDDDLFEWSLSDPGFWKKYIRYDVS